MEQGQSSPMRNGCPLRPLSTLKQMNPERNGNIMNFSNSNTTSSLFAPFTVVLRLEKEWNTLFIVLVDVDTKEKCIVGEVCPDTFEILLNTDRQGKCREIQCISEGDARRVITELGVRGELDELIEHYGRMPIFGVFNSLLDEV